jgi:hypothetical protein
MPSALTRTLPNLFIIGAAKSGTTSLHRYLDAHPEISMSEPKEPLVFADEDWRERLAEFDQILPSRRAPVRGESSTIYTRFPIAEGVPERVAATCPAAKLVYIVRDPVERAVANWVQRRSNGFEHRALAAALADPHDPRNHYVAASRYATQLELWLEWFDRKRILILDQIELRRSRAETVLEVLRFLEVDPTVPENLATEFNATEEKRGMTPAAARVWLTLSPLTRRLPPELRRSLSESRLFPVGPIETPGLDGEIRAALARELSGEADRFRELSGMAFESWTV